MAARNALVLIGGQPQELPAGDTLNGAGSGGALERLFNVEEASALTGTARWYPDRSISVSSVYFSLGTAASTSSTVIDVKKNGSTVFSGTYPTASTGQYKSTVVSGLSVAVTASDYLTVDITTGSDAKQLTVVIVYS